MLATWNIPISSYLPLPAVNNVSLVFHILQESLQISSFRQEYGCYSVGHLAFIIQQELQTHVLHSLSQDSSTFLVSSHSCFYATVSQCIVKSNVQSPEQVYVWCVRSLVLSLSRDVAALPDSGKLSCPFPESVFPEHRSCRIRKRNQDKLPGTCRQRK